ncbi:MAG: retroviral-like aspartic protease family protein [Flavobacteriales bacterium]|nr:retroviral-like aspartic protease family protein [Flavobacteriales bacterium]
MASSIRKTRIPLEILNIDETGIHICLTVTLNRKKARMVLDTGASRTVFDQKEINRFVKEGTRVIDGRMSAGLGTDSMETHSVTLNSFKINALTKKDFEALALDLHVLVKSYETLGHGNVVGVLGSDILLEHNAVIDFGKQKLILSYPKD